MPEDVIIEADGSLTIQGEAVEQLEELARLLKLAPEAALEVALHDALASRQLEVGV